MTITVNGAAVGEHDIAAETQNHPAPSAVAAREAAAQALVIRELLVQEARRLGLDPDEEGAFDELLAGQISVPEADEATCRRYYERHRASFRTPELYEAHHILIAAEPGNPAALERAKAASTALIAILEREPNRFAGLAAMHSACPSKAAGGSLGQVGRREIAAELTTFLAALDEGQLCPVPVCTRHGAHVLRLDRRAGAADLPYEAVRGRIASYLGDAVWRRAVSEYIGLLAGRARITGIDMPGWVTPLVQ